MRRGEQLFCRVADPKQTPKRAALFGRADFFRVRDLARLGLGRVAHEQYRFDDARYYYYLVPNDSERLGTIVTSDEQPLAGARVEARSGTRVVGRANASQSGEFRIDRLPAGTYAVVAQRLGYAPLT